MLGWHSHRVEELLHNSHNSNIIHLDSHIRNQISHTEKENIIRVIENNLFQFLSTEIIHLQGSLRHKCINNMGIEARTQESSNLLDNQGRVNMISNHQTRLVVLLDISSNNK
jgi:hypothetical protein